MPDKDKNNTPQDNKDKEIKKDNSKEESGKMEDSKKETKSLKSKESEKKLEKSAANDKIGKRKDDSGASKDEKNASDKVESKPEKKDKASKDNPADSNYQVSLVDENTLKIKIKTDKGVSLNSSVGGKNIIPKNLEGLLQNINDDQEIEIEISINPEKKTPVTKDEDPQDKSEDSSKDSSKSGVLIPNPEVENIVKQTEPFQEEVEPPSDEDLLRDRIGKKSPFNVYRRVYAQNFQIGLVSGVVIYLIAVFSFFAWASKDKIVEEDEQRRLIVLQDLPDPKINLQNVEDPNAPPEEEATEEDGIIPKKIPNVRNFRRGPTIKRPFVENKDTTGTNDTSGVKDTTGLAGDTTTDKDTTGASGNKFPDSLMTNYDGTEIGINMNVPNGWKVIDPKSINTNMEEFAGLIISDTTVKKGDINMFIKIEKENTPFNKDSYPNLYPMQDSSIITYSADPKEIGGNIEYDFYIFGGVKTLKIDVDVKKELFEKYKTAIETTVSSIRFPQPPQ